MKKIERWGWEQIRSQLCLSFFCLMPLKHLTALFPTASLSDIHCSYFRHILIMYQGRKCLHWPPWKTIDAELWNYPPIIFLYPNSRVFHGVSDIDCTFPFPIWCIMVSALSCQFKTLYMKIFRDRVRIRMLGGKII